MKHLAICLDYDGSIRTEENIDTENTGKTKTIIELNEQLWAFIKALCGKNPDLEVLTLAHFSARQSCHSDHGNSIRNKNGSYFLAMKQIHAYVSEFVNNINPKIKIELNCLLMPDIYHKRYPGSTHAKAIECINMPDTLVPFDLTLSDEFKISLVFAHTHHIQAEEFYFLDDRLDILQSIIDFYSNEIGCSFIPERKKIFLVNYDDGSFNPLYIKGFIGTGKSGVDFKHVLCDLHKSGYIEFPSLEIFKAIFERNIQTIGTSAETTGMTTPPVNKSKRKFKEIEESSDFQSPLTLFSSAKKAKTATHDYNLRNRKGV